MTTKVRQFKEAIGLKKKRRPDPVDPRDSGKGKLDRLLSEVTGSLSERVKALEPPNQNATSLLDEAKKLTYDGKDHVAAEKKVFQLKRLLDKAESVGAELKQLQPLRGEVAQKAPEVQTELERLAIAAEFYASAGDLDGAKAKIDLLKERLHPEAVLRQLNAELQSTLAEQVARQPKETRDELVKCLNDARKATDSGNLQDAKAKVADLKNRLDPDPVPKLKAENDLNKRIEIAEKYLAAHPGNSKEAAEVEDILAEAKKQVGVEMTLKAYLAQFVRQKMPGINPDGKFNLRHGFKVDTQIKAEDMQKIVSDTGLSEAEVLAIATYSDDTYKIINPAVANQKDHPEKQRGGKDWMDTNNRPERKNFKDDATYEAAVKKYEAKMPDPKDAKYKNDKEQYLKDLQAFDSANSDNHNRKDNMYQQGALHAAVALAGLKKLPKKVGETYRGERMTLAAFNSTYKEGAVLTDQAFVSRSTNKAEAEKFADGGGSVEIKPDQTVRVLVTTQVFEGRDIKAISVNKKEDEWLMLPDSSYRIERIESPANGPEGRDDAPAATAWRNVYMTQIYKGP